MASTTLRSSVLLATALAAGCSGAEAPDPAVDLVREAATPTERGRAAALTAIETAALVSDLHGFLQGSLGLAGGLGGGTIPTPRQLSFSAPHGCTHHGSFGSGGITLMHDCTMPSGRHTSGSLSVRFGAGCTPFGLSIEHHLVVESAPGAGDEIVIDGTTDLGFGGGRLTLATTLESHVFAGGHTIDHSVAGCFILDHRQAAMAMNGHVISQVDGVRRSVEIRDLQMSFCEGIPYTGTIAVEAEPHLVEVIFDRDSPETATVDVRAGSSSAHVELGIPPAARSCAIRTGGGGPMMIDYATCGGCGQPPKPQPPSSGGGGNGGGGGTSIPEL